MSTVTVYRYSRFDISNSMLWISKRYATRAAIDRLSLGKIDESSAVEIEPHFIDSNGQTALDFDPRNPTEP